MQNDPVRTVLVVLFLLSLFLGSLAGCGGGGGDPGNPDSPVKLQGTINGSLAVTVNSLPPGVPALVHVSGPGNYAADLTAPQTLGGIQPGEYTITALPVVAGTTTWTPSPATQTVTVASGATATASVTYALPPAQLALTRITSGLATPTFLTAPRNDQRQFVTERPGRILVLRGGAPLAQPFLDLVASTDVAGEGGLLSMAFDPGYAANGRFYVYRIDASHDIVVERYTVSGNPDVADPASRLEIIRIPHPQFTNHFGGQLAFGPDGYLSLGTGDGGITRHSVALDQDVVTGVGAVDVEAAIGGIVRVEGHRQQAAFAGNVGERAQVEKGLDLRHPAAQDQDAAGALGHELALVVPGRGEPGRAGQAAGDAREAELRRRHCIVHAGRCGGAGGNGHGLRLGQRNQGGGAGHDRQGGDRVLARFEAAQGLRPGEIGCVIAGTGHVHRGASAGRQAAHVHGQAAADDGLQFDGTVRVAWMAAAAAATGKRTEEQRHEEQDDQHGPYTVGLHDGLHGRHDV
jgi:hypothetical protein